MYTGTLIVLLYLQEHAQPFQQVNENATTKAITQRLHRLETFSLIVLIAMVWCAVFFVIRGLTCDNDPFCSVLGITVLGINFFFAVLCGIIFIKACGRKHHIVDKLSKLTESMMSHRSTHAISGSGHGGGGAAGGGGGGDGGGVTGSKEVIFQTVHHSSDSEMNVVKLNPMIRLGNGSGGNENGNNVVLEMRSMKSNVVTKNLEEKLPDGWETAIDEEGDVYFWNEETLATTWVRPNVSNM